jgi:4-nitrophenyl phosphatase
MTNQQSEISNQKFPCPLPRFLITDMDGVLWRGKEPLPGLPEFFQFLRDRSVHFMCATNNSSATPEKVAEKLRSFDTNVAADEIVTSSVALADHLRTILPARSKVYVIGMEGLIEAITRADFVIADEDVAAVIVGIDWNVAYNQLKRATLLIRSGAQFFGTNSDATFPSPEGIIPGAGSLLAMLETATSVKPIVIGKPATILYEIAMQRMGASVDETIALGDRLETDILSAINLNMKSILVLSGVTTPDQLAASDYQPNWVFEDISDLLNHWKGLTTDYTDATDENRKSV